MNQAEPNARTEQFANPFRPGNGLAPPYLAGRAGLLAEFQRFLDEDHPPHANWTLTGLRGTGKTVLLGEFATRGERVGWLCLERNSVTGMQSSWPPTLRNRASARTIKPEMNSIGASYGAW